MSETISLGELEAKRRTMTPGEWKLSDADPTRVVIYGHQEARFDDRRDALGVITKHAASPALLAATKTAME
jgi:hypothetical protein